MRFGPYGPYVQMDLPAASDASSEAATGKGKRSKSAKTKPPRYGPSPGMSRGLIFASGTLFACCPTHAGLLHRDVYCLAEPC